MGTIGENILLGVIGIAFLVYIIINRKKINTGFPSYSNWLLGGFAYTVFMMIIFASNNKASPDGKLNALITFVLIGCTLTIAVQQNIVSKKQTSLQEDINKRQENLNERYEYFNKAQLQLQQRTDKKETIEALYQVFVRVRYILAVFGDRQYRELASVEMAERVRAHLAGVWSDEVETELNLLDAKLSMGIAFVSENMKPIVTGTRDKYLELIIHTRELCRKNTNMLVVHDAWFKMKEPIQKLIEYQDIIEKSIIAELGMAEEKN